MVTLETKVTCHLCGHVWTYTGKSIKIYITCPCCFKKVKNPNYHKGREGDGS